MIQKPVNLESPPSISSASTFDDFETAVASFNQETRKARCSRMSAEDLSTLVSVALSEVQKDGTMSCECASADAL